MPFSWSFVLLDFCLRWREKMQLNSWSQARRKCRVHSISQKEQSSFTAQPCAQQNFMSQSIRIIKQCRSRTRHNHSTSCKSIRQNLERHYLKAAIFNHGCILKCALLLLNNVGKIIKVKLLATLLCQKKLSSKYSDELSFFYSVNSPLLCFAPVVSSPWTALSPLKILVPGSPFWRLEHANVLPTTHSHPPASPCTHWPHKS